MSDIKLRHEEEGIPLVFELGLMGVVRHYISEETARDLVFLLARRLGYVVIDPAAVMVFGQPEDIRRIKQEDGK